MFYYLTQLVQLSRQSVFSRPLVKWTRTPPAQRRTLTRHLGPLLGFAP